MPINKLALVRYKTIDNCLQNRFRKWTLEDLVEACSDALYEYEGMTIPFINLHHLVLTKLGTGRGKDKIDVEMLQQVQAIKIK